jgi:hypothetical protein
MDNEQAENPQAEVISLGANIAGAVGGGLVGGLIAGPLGLVLGGFAGPLLTEFAQRTLGRREKARIGALYRFVAVKAQANLDAGKIVRQDGFFSSKVDGDKADAEEIIEGVMLAAQREHEEKKVRYYANLLANIAFDSSVSKVDANLLIKVGAGLSYRQLCLLAIFGGSSIEGDLRSENYTLVNTAIRRPVVSALHEVFDLERMGLIACEGKFLFGITNVEPVNMIVEGTGQTLARLMELNEIPDEDLSEAAIPILATTNPSA